MAEKLNRSILGPDAIKARQDLAQAWVDLLAVFQNQIETLREVATEPPSKEFVESFRIVSDQIRRDTCVDGREGEDDQVVGQPKQSGQGKPESGKRYRVVGE